MLEDIFKNTIKRYQLIRPKDKVVLGVSGGPDSICLLHLFLKIKKDYALRLICAHFNHRLRQEARAEEDFVKEECKKYGVDFISEGKNVRDFSGDSLEQAARNLRFDFFLKISRQTKFKKLALAHHRDDLAETVLMRLIRGSGLRGLQGFSPQMHLGSLKVIRPLIELSKDDILAWLNKNKINYCLDQSNFQDKFFRNRIRLKLMPLLKELNPNIVENISNAARNISLDYSFLYDYSYKIFLSLKSRQVGQSLYLNLKKLKILPPAIFSNTMRIAIEELKGSTRRLEARHIDELSDLVLNRPQGSIVDLPFLLAKKDENHLLIQSLIL